MVLDDVLAARELLRGVARRTPLEGSRPLSEAVGGPVHLKCENLQRAGSFKIRGAYTRIARLPAHERALGVVAASAGNHAQGVALAASLLGAAATVVMPVGAAIPKVEATRAYGAEVVLAGTTVDEALDVARERAAATGASLIHPFDHQDVVAGQGTLGLEVLEQCPDVRTLLVCTGGGGLLAGTAVAVKALRPDVRVVGVQAAAAAAWPGSLRAGRPVALPRMATMADGIAVGRPGEVPFGLVRDLVDEVVTVQEATLSRALLLCLERAKLVVEPAGAAAVAALLEDPGRYEPPVVAVLSGGNVDPLLMVRVLRHGLAVAGRYLAVRVRLLDRAGSLAGVLQEVAATGASVLEVEHVRTDSRLSVDEVEAVVRLETRGAEHAEEVVARLRAAGHVVERA
ncbi:threonine ammonia-lyase [Vallicoccus soli]|uniref:threonine ammonia-lyase n=1 Tax=Vallicoccus soli TaxID=2339232 RepID=A0A3A3ZNC4_9ACTN|nr:threonine ammonia-lyase [Vallicoccus soli]